MATFCALWFASSLLAGIISGIVAIITAAKHNTTKRRWGRRCAVSFACAAAALLIVAILPGPDCNGEHTWQEATCTSCKTCDVCGQSEGEPLGHEYISVTTDPTCTEDGRIVRTCSRCEDCTEEPIAAAGHQVENWQILLDATCSAEGEKGGTCKICGEEAAREPIPKLEHTPGEWVVTKPATASAKGKQARTCTVCGTQLETREYEMTEAELKASCKSYTYEEIARRPADYEGKYAKFTGEVIQVLESGTSTQTKYTLRVNVTAGKWGYEDTIYVTYTASSGADRILEDDIVTMYGCLTGTKTYETVLGSSLTIPSFTASYIDIN